MNKNNRIKAVLLGIIVIVTLLLIGCASDDDRAETKGWSVEQLYTAASEALGSKNYTKAIKLYTTLEATYPYGVYAQQGMLDLAYAYYQNAQPELALPTIAQFINTYPTNANMDYALYLKGYINYKNDNGLLSRFTRQDLSERDPQGVQEAYKAFKELVTKYPNSRFVPDAKDKINRLVNALARGEIYRARYYMGIKAYLAAITRTQDVITNYANTPFVEEALAMQEFAYDKLGQAQLSRQTRQVLALNFPKSQYLVEEWKYQDMPWYQFWH